MCFCCRHSPVVLDINVKIFFMEWMCAQTRSRFLLSSERVVRNGVRTHFDSQGKGDRVQKEEFNGKTPLEPFANDILAVQYNTSISLSRFTLLSIRNRERGLFGYN